MKAWTDEECDALRKTLREDTSVTRFDRALIRAAVEEARREFHETILAEADKHPGCCHHVSDAILARDKEPHDAER